jgi:hypothetical protein
MKINKDELFDQVTAFLKRKGIDLQEGPYTRTIHKGCQVLADTINLSQQAIESAKTELERKLDQARQVIHQKTAPRKPPVYPASDSASASEAGRKGKVRRPPPRNKARRSSTSNRRTSKPPSKG